MIINNKKRTTITKSLFKCIPMPTGPYTVGSHFRTLIDSTRCDTDYPDGWPVPMMVHFPVRRLSPGDSDSGRRAFDRIIVPNSIPVWDHVQYQVFSEQTALLDMASGRWPVVIMNHGFTASHTDYASLTEDLASHGYVVISLLHQLDTDALNEPKYRKGRSFLRYARCVENMLFVYDWLCDHAKLFCNRIDLYRVCLMGHSMGSNAILLLMSRAMGLFGHPHAHLLPHRGPHASVREAVILMDFNVSLAMPSHSRIPVLFQISEERYHLYESHGVYDHLRAVGHNVVVHPQARHISFLDHGYLEPENHQADASLYFSGSIAQRQGFFDQLRQQNLSFLREAFSG